MYNLEEMSEKVVNYCKTLYTKYFYTVTQWVLYDLDPMEFQTLLM